MRTGRRRPGSVGIDAVPPEPTPLPDAPQPPAPPRDDECCQSGCERCVWVCYNEARRAYEQDYVRWLEQAEAALRAFD